ncbi:hypothetical protein ACSBR2_029611 [Camellia fascicularis]
MNEEMFFMVAQHNLTVVGMDGAYIKPINTDYIMITPGQTMDVLITANRTPSEYYMAARANAGLTYDNTTTTAIVQYSGNYTAPSTPAFLGKGVQKRLARKKGVKLHVYVNRMLNALTGGNATPATNELGLQIRRLCPLKGVKSWKKIDKSIKDAVVQAVLDTFEIGEDFHTDQQAQEIVDMKAYLLYKDWRYILKQHYEKLVEKGVDDQYSNPPKGVCLDDWKHMIDVAWKDESHLKRSKAGKANRSLLPYNHTSGSRSFPIAMSLMDAMVNLQVTATDTGSPLTHEELSRQVLGQRKNYLRGFGIGP